MRAIIIEDEAIAAERLEKMIKEVSPETEIIARLNSIKDSVSWFMNNSADLIFLDIQLSDGLSFSIFDQAEINTPVIFTTAYDEYAIKAFKLNSISYLLKPVRKEELTESIRKYKSLQSAYKIDFNSLIAAIHGKQNDYKKRFLIQYGDKIKKIEVTDIAYFYAMEKSNFVKTNQNNSYPIDFTLDKLENLLDPEVFFRINRKFLISMGSISKMTAWSRSRIKLELNPPADGEDLAIVSIERSADFKKWMS